MAAQRTNLIRKSMAALLAVAALVVGLYLTQGGSGATTSQGDASNLPSAPRSLRQADTPMDQVPAAGASPPKGSQALAAHASGSDVDAVKLLRRPEAEALAFERTMLAGRSIDAQASDLMLRSKDFDRAMAQFEMQMRQDPLALEMRDAFVEKISTQMRNDPDMPRLRLVCGVNLCIGEMTSKPGESFQRWRAMQFRRDRASDIAAMSSIEPIQVGDEDAHRFVFTTDPKFGSITLPINR